MSCIPVIKCLNNPRRGQTWWSIRGHCFNVPCCPTHHHHYGVDIILRAGVSENKSLSRYTSQLSAAHSSDASLLCIRDCNGISKLPIIHPILPYIISFICGSSDIPLLSLTMHTRGWWGCGHCMEEMCVMLECCEEKQGLRTKASYHLPSLFLWCCGSGLIIKSTRYILLFCYWKHRP